MEKKAKNKDKITKKTKFSNILKKHPEVSEVFMNEGMYCIGCPMNTEETIEQGSLAHGKNPDKIMEKINKQLLLKVGKSRKGK